MWQTTVLAEQVIRQGTQGQHVLSHNAGDLDEAVQALKATTGGNDSPRNMNSNPQHASGALTDDDLKPAFMRRLTSDRLQPDGTVTTEEAQLMGALQARQGGELDMNPRPVSRRRLDPAATARKAAATAVLKVQSLRLRASSCGHYYPATC